MPVSDYNANTNWKNEEKYLNNLIAQGGGNAQWAQQQMNDLKTAQSQYASTPVPTAQSSPVGANTTTPQSVNQSAPAGQVYLPTVLNQGTTDSYTGQQNTQGKQIGYGTAEDTGYYTTDAQGTTWYVLNGMAYNMSAGVPGTNTSGTVWTQSDLSKINGAGNQSSLPSNYDIMATGYSPSAPNNSILEQLHAAQVAAEAAAAANRDYNINLINQQMAGLTDQEATQRAQIYQDSRVKALQNAEIQAAMGMGGNPYAEAPSGYAESARLREDAAMRGLLNDVSQQNMDAQRALENMKTNAAVLGEQEINKATSDWSLQIANMMYQQGRDSRDDAYRAWQMSRAEGQDQIAQQQQQWENSYRMMALQYGMSQDVIDQNIAMAKQQAVYGDFSGYRLLGLDDASIQQMESEYARQIAMEEKTLNAKLSSGGGSSSNSSVSDMIRRAQLEMEIHGQLRSPDLIAYFGGSGALSLNSSSIPGPTQQANTPLSYIPGISSTMPSQVNNWNLNANSMATALTRQLIGQGLSNQEIQAQLQSLGLLRG